jgi:hypothetical protein
MKKIIKKNPVDTLPLDAEEVINHIKNEHAEYAVFNDERDPRRCDPGILVIDKSHDTIIMVGVKGLSTYSSEDHTDKIESYINDGFLYQVKVIDVR